MSRPNYNQQPQDFSKLGVGALQAVSNTPWAKIATYYYDVQQFQFPLTTSEFDSSFGATIKVFSLQENQPCPGRQTNAAVGSSVNEPFVALGAGIVAIGENKAFTLPGQLVGRAAVAGTCPDIAGCAEAPGSIGGEDAALYWGGSTWQFIANFFQAYRLQIAINRRFLVVDESLFDVGMVPVPPEFVGASSSLVPGMPYVQETNAILKAKGCDKIFMPQNVAGSLCVGAPTAGVTYGHPRIQGLSNRIFCFNYPLLFVPGMSFDVQFTRVENDCCFLPAMRRNSVLDCAGSAPTPDADLAAGCGAAWTVPGGCLSIGLVFKGYALQPAACVEFLAGLCLPGVSDAYMNMYLGNPYLGSLMASPAIKAHLAGIPDDIKKRFLGQPSQTP